MTGDATSAATPGPDGPAWVFVSYGMVKSGSTLAFEYMRGMHEASGWPQERLPLTLLPKPSSINFAGPQDDMTLLRRHAESTGRPVVVKTHSAPTASILAGLREGWLRAHATYRDPRDMVLSLLDAGARARARSAERGFAGIETVEDALRAVRRNSDVLHRWLEAPGVQPLLYDDLAFDPVPTVRRMGRHARLRVAAAAIVRRVTKDRFTQLNKGRPMRHSDEMDPALSERLRGEFAPFFDHLLERRPRLSPGRPQPPLRIEPLDGTANPRVGSADAVGQD